MTALARAGLLVSAAFLVSRLLGWVRLVVVVAAVGVGPELDAFYAAFRLPDLVFQLVAGGALASAVIPVLADLRAHGEPDRARRVVGAVGTILVVVLGLLGLLLVVLAPAVVPLVTPGFDPARLAVTIELTRIMALSPVLLALGALASSVLNAEGRFAASVLAPIAYNVSIILGALVLHPLLGVAGLAVAVVVGSGAHLAVQVVPLRRLGWPRGPRPVGGDEAVRRVLVLLAPRAVGLGSVQVTLLVLTVLASTLPTGSVAALTIAFTLLQIPLGVIGMALGTVVLPALARDLAGGDEDEFARRVTRGLRLIVAVMVPLTGLGILFRGEVVALVFAAGGLDAPSASAIAATLLCFLLGLTAHGLITVLARAFYAGQDTRTPVAIAIAGAGLTVAIAAGAVGTLGLPALALGVALGAWAEAGAQLAILVRRHPAIRPGRIAGALGAAAAGTAVAVTAAFAVAAILTAVAPGAGPVAAAVVGTVAGLGAHLLVVRALGLDEVGTLAATAVAVALRR